MPQNSFSAKNNVGHNYFADARTPRSQLGGGRERSEVVEIYHHVTEYMLSICFVEGARTVPRAPRAPRREWVTGAELVGIRLEP